MSTRPRKVDTIVLGRGLAAAALAAALVQRGQRVALLVEAPGWERGTRAAWPGWHADERATLAAEGVAWLGAAQAAGLPGLRTEAQGDGPPLWLLHYDVLLPALGDRVAAGAHCHVAVGTHVRGLSVIEGAVLGAIAEDSRYDARRLVNAAEDHRYAAFARMLRQPHALDLYPFTPTASEVADARAGTWPGAAPFERDRHAPAAEATAVRGAWRLVGVAGWPLLALGLAERLAERLVSD